MKSCHQRCLASLFLLFIFSKTVAQDQRAYNQNSARSNQGLSISFSPLYSTATKSGSDSLLFRGSGAGLRFGADYFFGNAGISFVSGFGSSSPDDATINNFLKHSSIPTDQLLITKTKQQNMYLLLGPSVRFGSKVQLYAHAKGGLFINNSGLISMQQRGAQKILYRNESTNKNIYPGFLTGLKVQYSTKSDAWSFGIGTDYMHTRSEVNNYDARRGGGIEALKLSRNITDLVTGITIQYNIRSPRDAASGQASGKRKVGKPKYGDIKVTGREAASGMATGRKIYQPGQPVYGNIAREESATESCGAVTQRITNPDGTTEEMTFACPADAASYNERISMNVTVPKQTQGATFGEKVNQGLHAAGSALSQGRNIISGRLSTASESSTGIITNETAAVSSVGNLAGGAGGGAAAASYARTSNNQSTVSGIVTTIYAREAGSGQASGRRSRDAGSGMATGRRQYQPVFTEGQGAVCDPCIATAKMSNVNNNPLYKDKGLSGVNPMYESKVTTGGADNDCDGIVGMTVSLVEPQSGAVIAKTTTERCGDFFFANVPDGDYVVKISGRFLSKKGYDYYAAKSKTDVLGKVTLGNDALQLLINTGGDDDGDMVQKAGISTSRSNIRRCRSITIVDADTDGDGVFESTKVLAELYDGTTKDITAFSRMTTAGVVKKVTVRGWDPEKKQGIAGSANTVKEYTISIGSDNKAAVTNQYENGTKEELTVAARVSHHPNVVQFIIPLGEEDTEVANTGARAKITKSRSNIQNNRMTNDDGEDIWSPRYNIKMLRLVPADMDGDGNLEMTVAAPFVPGGGIVSAARPGNPIGGLNIKGGKNPGGNQRTVQTNENGEFEFTDLEPGDYTFSIEQTILLDDETLVSVGNDATNINTGESGAKGTAPQKKTNEKSNAVILDTQSNDRIVDEQDAKKAMTFRWTPLVPKPKEPVTYRLRVWQLMQGQNGTQAMRTNNPVAEKTVTGSTTTTIQGIWTGPCKPPYLCDFIWSVQAVSSAGKSIASTYDNQAWSFSVKQPGDDNEAVTKAQDHNSSRSNKTASIADGDIDNEAANNAARKGWDGTVKGGSKTKAQDHNSSRSNKSGIAADNDPDDGDDAARKGWDGTVKGGSKIQAQDAASEAERKGEVKVTASQNTQSLRSILIEADLDGDGVYETDLTGKTKDELMLNDKGDITELQQKAGISTSRSNIRNRKSLQSVGEKIYVGYGTTIVGKKEVPVKVVYKVVEKATSGLKDTLKTQV